MSEAVEPSLPGAIETFQSRFPLDLQPHWRRSFPDGHSGQALSHPWGKAHRPDWTARGLIVWPRGRQWCRLKLRLPCPLAWRSLGPEVARARLTLCWWADRTQLLIDGEPVLAGDLFDAARRWTLPRRWWQGEALELELNLRSPLHDEGALVRSGIELEPLDPADPHGLLNGTRAELGALRQRHHHGEGPGQGRFHLLGHAHLDLAWLWPVSDTWQAAERTFTSALELMGRFPALHFGHSTPALYAWIERQRPALFHRIRAAMRSGRWEPLNGPWVETDCVLVSTASLLRQFQEGQHYSRDAFPEWEHNLAWLPDSFGFAAGLPAVAAATGVRWFCTHKLAWNATNPFPHRLFRWRSRCGSEVLALMTAPIGTDGDPVAMERYRLEWQHSAGCLDALWLPGVGDHGGGPTAEMLEQLELWQGRSEAAAQHHGSLRSYLGALEPLAAGLPVWRDELYLELHRGCATSRPDQKRHNRSLERLLREAELASALCGALPCGEEPPEWRSLLFQQFHDILPGTSIPEVFEQAEPEWRAARRRARRLRDRLLAGPPSAGGDRPTWRVVQLLPLPAAPRTLRLPRGRWSLRAAGGTAIPLAGQPAPGGGQWTQLPGIAGADRLLLERTTSASPSAAAQAGERAIDHPVLLEPAADLGPGRWRLGNGLLTAAIGPLGVEQLWDREGQAQLAGPLQWCRWQDRGQFWDAWDIAPRYRDHPLPWIWQAPPEWVERGPLCVRFLQRGLCGNSPVRLDGRLLAGTPWLELVLSLGWRQRHELLRLEIPLERPAHRWASDTAGGVIERPAVARTPREGERWEVAALSWLASAPGPPGAGGLAVLLDGPQGVSARQDLLGVSLLRAPTWPDPGADNGWQRLRLALMACSGGWRRAGVPNQARRFREPLWCHPAGPDQGIDWTPFPSQQEDLQLVALRPAPDGSGEVIVSVQNAGPCRRELALAEAWQLVGRLDGLDQPLETRRKGAGTEGTAADRLQLAPWELGFWRLRARERSMALPERR